jgi:glycosyltransferase involved in cell wall biosynthesis
LVPLFMNDSTESKNGDNMSLPSNATIISVIIPTYNRKNHLKYSIQSVLNQSLPPHEIIIVDDGSNDGTDAYIKDLQKKQQNIKYFYQKNSGSGAARNRGLIESKGNIIAFLDSDDIWTKNHLKESVLCFNKKSDISAVFSKYEVTFSGENSLASGQLKQKYERRDHIVKLGQQAEDDIYLLHKELCLDAELMEKISFLTSTMVLFIDRLKYIYTFDAMLRIGEDIDFRLQMMSNQEQIAYIDKIHSQYVYHNANTIANKQDSILTLYEKQKKILNFFLKSMTYCKSPEQYRFRLNKISSHYYLLGSLALELGKFSAAVEKYFQNSLIYKFNFAAFKHLLLYKIIGVKKYSSLYKIKSSIGKNQKI